jgi:hypothetical protein
MNDLIILGGCVMLVIAAFCPRHKVKVVRSNDPLDKPIFNWNGIDMLTWRGLLAGGISVFGRTDSGKTSAMKLLMRAIMQHGNSSMLILCAKTGEYLDVLKCVKEAGREKDVLLIDPSQPHRINMIGLEATREGEGGGQAVNVTRFLMGLRSVVFRENEQGGGEQLQWRKQDERLTCHAVTLLMLAGEKVTPANIHKLILSAPDSAMQLRDDEWKAGYCNQTIGKAFERDKTTVQEHDFKLAGDYFLREWPRMADRTRSSILVGTMATLTVMNTGLARELFAERTTFTLKQAIEGRAIVIINMPPDVYGDLGLIANVGLKELWQNEVLRRNVKADSPISVIWGDESSIWATSSDAKYLSRCRSHRGCMVYICQSLPAYKEALPGDKAEAATESMQANFGLKVIFSLGDHATAQWCSDLVGKELQQFGGGSVQNSNEIRLMREHSHHSSSFNEHYEHILQPYSFMNGMRTGSPVNGYMVDAVLVRSGVPFSNGLPYLNVTFDQRS